MVESVAVAAPVADTASLIAWIAAATFGAAPVAGGVLFGEAAIEALVFGADDDGAAGVVADEVPTPLLPHDDSITSPLAAIARVLFHECIERTDCLLGRPFCKTSSRTDSQPSVSPTERPARRRASARGNRGNAATALNSSCVERDRSRRPLPGA